MLWCSNGLTAKTVYSKDIGEGDSNEEVLYEAIQKTIGGSDVSVFVCLESSGRREQLNRRLTATGLDRVRTLKSKFRRCPEDQRP